MQLPIVRDGPPPTPCAACMSWEPFAPSACMGMCRASRSPNFSLATYDDDTCSEAYEVEDDDKGKANPEIPF